MLRFYILFLLPLCMLLAQDVDNAEQLEIIQYYCTKLAIDATELNSWSLDTYGQPVTKLGELELIQTIEVLQIAYSQQRSLKIASEYYFGESEKVRHNIGQPKRSSGTSNKPSTMRDTWKTGSTWYRVGIGVGPIAGVERQWDEFHYFRYTVGYGKKTSARQLWISANYYNYTRIRESTWTHHDIQKPWYNNEFKNYTFLRLYSSADRKRSTFGFGLTLWYGVIEHNEIDWNYSYSTGTATSQTYHRKFIDSGGFPYIYFRYGDRQFIEFSGLMGGHVPMGSLIQIQLSLGYRSKANGYVLRYGFSNSLNMGDGSGLPMFAGIEWQPNPEVRVYVSTAFLPFVLLDGFYEIVDNVSVTIDWKLNQSITTL